jgi:hypothetical protein
VSADTNDTDTASNPAGGAVVGEEEGTVDVVVAEAALGVCAGRGCRGEHAASNNAPAATAVRPRFPIRP